MDDDLLNNENFNQFIDENLIENLESNLNQEHIYQNPDLIPSSTPNIQNHSLAQNYTENFAESSNFNQHLGPNQTSTQVPVQNPLETENFSIFSPVHEKSSSSSPLEIKNIHPESNKFSETLTIDSDDEIIEPGKEHVNPGVNQEKSETIETPDDDDCLIVTSSKTALEDGDSTDEDADTVSKSIKQSSKSLKIPLWCCKHQDGDTTDRSIPLPELVQKAIQPHQVEGIHFLWRPLVKKSGIGVVLAHSMGLGKTVQTISIISSFLKLPQPKSGKVLVVVPVNTIYNWLDEFNKWDPEETRSPKYRVLNLREISKRTDKPECIIEWRMSVDPSVLIIGYEAFRAFCLPSNKTVNPTIQSALQSSDLIVCDEAHRIKDEKTRLNEALKNVKTTRRLGLTGYPLQNSLSEYYVLIDWVRPNFLGTKKGFVANFETPINEGKTFDASEVEKKRMMLKTHVLRNLIKTVVHRRDYSTLHSSLLPTKSEFVIGVRLSELQKKLYNEMVQYMTSVAEAAKALGGVSSGPRGNPIEIHSLGMKIWNHPWVLLEEYKNALDKSKGGSDKGGFRGTVDENLAVKGLAFLENRNEDNQTVYEEVMEKWPQPTKTVYSNKLQFLFKLIERRVIPNTEKLLIFSQSLKSLNMIENLSSQYSRLGVKLIRLDGSTGPDERREKIKKFQSPQNKNTPIIFLLSTKAGCLGINLTAAKRVVLFDVSWNPCHDAQAICRAFRIGQKQKVNVYRFVAQQTMEERVLQRQVGKQTVANRVLDKDAKLTRCSKMILNHLYYYSEEKMRDVNVDSCKEQCGGKDEFLAEEAEHYVNLLARLPRSVDTLQVPDFGTKLSKEEKRNARIRYSYERSGGQTNPFRQNHTQPRSGASTTVQVPVYSFAQRQKLQQLEHEARVLQHQNQSAYIYNQQFQNQHIGQYPNQFANVHNPNMINPFLNQNLTNPTNILPSTSNSILQHQTTQHFPAFEPPLSKKPKTNGNFSIEGLPTLPGNPSLKPSPIQLKSTISSHEKTAESQKQRNSQQHQSLANWEKANQHKIATSSNWQNEQNKLKNRDKGASKKNAIVIIDSD